MNARVRAVVHKEFKEYRRNKMILLTAMVMPLVFLALPLASTLPLSAAAPHHEIVAVVGTAMLLFLVVPVMIPTTIAAYSIIGEREQGTLEPLLTTTVTDRELLLGKALAAIAPAISIAWMLYGAYTLVVRLFASPPVAREIWSVHWLVAQLLVTPALSVLAILVGMVISVRSNDIRVAQQFSALALVPVLVGVALVTNQVVAPTVTLFVYAALVLAVVDRFLWRAVNRLFDRERLITRFG